MTDPTPTNSSTERRRFRRISFDAGCELQTANGPVEVKLVDISLRGALIEASHVLPLDIAGQAELHIYLASDILIRMPGKVTHLRGSQYGFQAGTLDLDSISYLRRLVELNLGDEALLERELDAIFAEHTN